MLLKIWCLSVFKNSKNWILDNCIIELKTDGVSKLGESLFVFKLIKFKKNRYGYYYSDADGMFRSALKTLYIIRIIYNIDIYSNAIYILCI